MERFSQEKDDFINRPRERAVETGTQPRVAKKSKRPQNRGAKTSSYVIFMLGLQGHRRQVNDPAKARELYDASKKYVVLVKRDIRKRGFKNAHIEVHEFNSFAELITKRPRRKGRKWSFIMVVTHGTPRFVSDAEKNVAHTGIVLGDKEYFASHPDPNHNIYNAMNENIDTLTSFRDRFDRRANLQIVACGMGSTELAVADFMRDLFAVDGVASMPITSVDFDPATGILGKVVEGDPTHTERIKDQDWAILPAR